MRQIELLAPARTADIGIEAIKHGADAVYIGAPAFSARAAAANSVADIEQLASFGHQYGARTMVAFNTILTDRELVEAERLIWQLYEAGTDALIVQDLGLLQLNLPPIELHASTQTDNRTVEKVRLWRDLGMKRVVLARELSIDQIAAIHAAVPDVELECFVHGALCVCISGQCYMSAALNGRSANRGECAQPCRLPMDLYSADGEKLLASQRHLLSLRDMNRSAYLEQLIDAGVTSLKIEGRLKEMSYVKNVVAYYRRLLDGIYERRSDLAPLSQGSITYTFEPQADKSFNRGFTPYFADGQRSPMWNFDSPKSQGEKVGQIVRVNRDSFVFEGKALHNGDGLAVGQLGFRLNRYEAATKQCYPLEGLKVCKQLRPGMKVFRNLDIEFEQLLAKPSATRNITVEMEYKASASQLQLMLRCEDGIETEVICEGNFDKAERPQFENISRQLSKLGGTIFKMSGLSIEGDDYFVPSSILAELRRSGVTKLIDERHKLLSQPRKSCCANDYANSAKNVSAEGILPVNFQANILNQKARQMMSIMGLKDVDDAFEIQQDKEGMVMQTKHCLRYAFGQCPKYRNPNPETLLDRSYKIGDKLVLKIGPRKFFVNFGCKNDCICKIFTIFAPKNKKSYNEQQ